MEKTKEITTHTIDASGRALGRVASETAIILMGKNSADFKRNEVANVKVTVENVSKLKVPLKKLTEKAYIHYTGFPGGLRSETLGHLVDRKGYGAAFEKAVYGMLPSNRLRKLVMKNLTITE